MKELNVRNVVPLYEQVEGDIREKIRTKVYAEGDQIPTEMELCEKYGISRITVRRALDELVNEGYLERRHGKGTFVAMQRAKINWLSDGSLTCGFSDTAGKDWQRRIIAKREYEPTVYETELLQLEEGDRIQILERLIWDDHIIILEKAGYSCKRYPGLLAQIENDTSTYKVLREKYGMVQKRMRREISLAYATEKQAKLFGCLSGVPLFQIVKVLYDQDDKPVHFSMLYYRADTTIIHLDR